MGKRPFSLVNITANNELDFAFFSGVATEGNHVIFSKGGDMTAKRVLKMGTTIVLFVFLSGCAGIPVRDAVKVDVNLPVGTVEGNQFTGVRYPFKVSAPGGWKIVTEYPKFMMDLGYHKEGLEESEVFLFNPQTQSNLQIDFTAAGRYSTFDQGKMEILVNSVTGEVEDEVKEHFGKDVKVTHGPTEAVALKGVSFAARKYSTFKVEGQTREQGWIYAFSEPYQIFILYLIMEKDAGNDRKTIKAILDSFEYIPVAKK